MTASPNPEPPAGYGENARTPQGPRRFRPKLAITLIALVLLGVLLSLGTWQAMRYQEASETLAYYTEQHHTRDPLTHLGGIASPDNTLDLQYRRVDLKGRLDLEGIALLTARYKLNTLGYGVLAPLVVPGEDGAKPTKLLVNLGWVPRDRLQGYLDTLKAKPDGFTVQGRLQKVDPSLNLPEIKPAGEAEGFKTWMFWAPAAMSGDVPDLNPEWIILSGKEADGSRVDLDNLPHAGYRPLPRLSPAKHIEYSMTWYGVALALIAVYFSLSFRRDDEDAPPPESNGRPISMPPPDWS